MLQLFYSTCHQEGKQASKSRASSQSIYYLKTNFSEEERKDDKQAPLSRVAYNHQEDIVTYKPQEPWLTPKHHSHGALGTCVSQFPL